MIVEDELNIFFGKNMKYRIKDQSIRHEDFKVVKAIEEDGCLYIYCYGTNADDLFFVASPEKQSKFQIGEGVQDYLVENGHIYIVFSEEGIFSGEGNTKFSESIFVQIDTRRETILPLLPTDMQSAIIDVYGICFDGESTIRLFYCGEIVEESDYSYEDFYLDYNIRTKQITKNRQLDSNILCVGFANDSYYVLENSSSKVKKGIVLVTNQHMEVKSKIFIDSNTWKKITRVNHGYEEFILESKDCYTILNLNEVKK
ncbi:hypothetical protein [Listeria fleischmannii]|uniref:hypothetical protein n=1 Tax=Listeria fleischmannii TaxID=1069827 RepID=UPI0002BA6C85|nr:hypothetical protein [Listeria fleischmannii]EMG27373.1 hypothetical protein LFLEISCH_11460 [Listeria fleischmannii subsp. fleischmannii LU2006-1]